MHGSTAALSLLTSAFDETKDVFSNRYTDSEFRIPQLSKERESTRKRKAFTTRRGYVHVRWNWNGSLLLAQIPNVTSATFKNTKIQNPETFITRRAYVHFRWSLSASQYSRRFRISHPELSNNMKNLAIMHCRYFWKPKENNMFIICNYSGRQHFTMFGILW